MPSQAKIVRSKYRKANKRVRTKLRKQKPEPVVVRVLVGKE